MTEEKKTSLTLYPAVESTVGKLQKDLLRPETSSTARATLARLRTLRGSLGLGAALEQLVLPLSERETGLGDAPSPSEQAVMDALALFATHMQGSFTSPAHTKDRTFATACGILYRRTGSGSVKRRFDRAVSAVDPQTRVYYIRSLVSMLSSEGISFDYARLACDLRRMQKNTRSVYLDESSAGVRLGRDFARAVAGEVGSKSPTSV